MHGGAKEQVKTCQSNSFQPLAESNYEAAQNIKLDAGS